MKGPLDRTKVVLRHLPPSISQSALMEQVDTRFAGRYNWFSFFPGKTSHNRMLHSRAYIDFKTAGDVIEFAEFFDKHVFVNEKGTQFKTIVEYAPSQRVPKQWSKKDGREGTILKDPEYMEFLEFISKPVENLPSAEIQLERKEAERAGASKEAPIVTPLMDFVRQKRAAKSGSRRSVANGKSTRRISGSSTGIPSSNSSKRGSDKRRIPTTMYVQRDRTKGAGGKDKPTYVLVSKRNDQHVSEKSAASGAVTGATPGEEESGDSGKKILLLKEKEKEIPNITGGLSIHQSTNAPVRNSPPANMRQNQNQRREASGGKIIRSMISKDNNQSVVKSEQQNQNSYLEKDKRPPRPPSVHLLQRDNLVSEDKVHNDYHGVHSEKPERRTRNKDRPDRVVWTALRRSDGPHASDESLSSSASQSALDSAEGAQLEIRNEISIGRGGSGRGSHSSADNGFYKHGGRRGSAHLKDSDESSFVEGKPLRRAGGSSGSGHSEKQVWVQKSSSGS